MCMFVCVCVQCSPSQSLQITDTHHRWPARLIFSPPSSARIMASGGPSSSFSAPSLFCQHVCPSNGSVCLRQWQQDKESAYPPPGHWIGGHVGLVIKGTIALEEREREGVAPQHPLQLGMVKVQPGWPWVQIWTCKVELFKWRPSNKQNSQKSLNSHMINIFFKSKNDSPNY